MAVANATITAPTASQIGNFGATIVFEESILVSSLQKTDINLSAVSGNGVTGVDFEIMAPGTEATQFHLPFTLPNNAEGSFEIQITGEVRRSSGSAPIAVMANTVTVEYDTTTAKDATFGTPATTGREIRVPVVFTEAVELDTFKVHERLVTGFT